VGHEDDEVSAMRTTIITGLVFVLSLAFSACPRPAVPEEDFTAASAPATEERFAVEYNRPEGPPRLDTGALDEMGKPITVSCTVCHTTKEPNFARNTSEDLDLFHQGLVFNHADLTCLSCHNADNYDSLRLVDGRSLAYPDVMNLCAQCHGQQYRDYEMGAHGGMTGYWDLSKGPQHRNNCIECHDPHFPAFQGMIPAPGPRDRFLSSLNDALRGEVEHHE